MQNVETDLRNYLPQLASQQAVSEMRPTPRAEPVVASLSEVEGAITMADLLAAHRFTARQAKYRLETLAGRNPGNSQADELLSYLAAQEAGAVTSH